MPVAPCSSLAAPRVASACRLDRPGPQPASLPVLGAGGGADPPISAVVHMVPATGVDLTAGGVRDRARPRTRRRPQSSAAPAAGDPDRTRPDRTATAADDAHRGHSCGERTDVRPAATEYGATASEGSFGWELPSELTGSQRFLLRAIEWYQRGAEGRPSPCRFYPSCSAYGHAAIVVHGTRRGLWLTVKRLLRCRPFGPSGFDPVPEPAARPERPAEASGTALDGRARLEAGPPEYSSRKAPA